MLLKVIDVLLSRKHPRDITDRLRKGGCNMKKFSRVWVLIIVLFCAGVMGCDSGKDAVDDVTGSKSVKQFQKSKKDIDKAVQRQAEKYKDATDNEAGKKDSEDTEEEK
jgi:hypothetical protein